MSGSGACIASLISPWCLGHAVLLPLHSGKLLSDLDLEHSHLSRDNKDICLICLINFQQGWGRQCRAGEKLRLESERALASLNQLAAREICLGFVRGGEFVSAEGDRLVGKRAS